MPAALVAIGILLVTAATALAAGETITLNLQAGVSQTAKACKQTNHYTAYKLGTKILMDGYVTPAPALPDQTWKVKIKVKKCVHGKFKTIKQVHVLGNGVLVNNVKEGHWRWAFKPKMKGFYFARAYYYGYTPYIQTTEENFHVR